jgi:hypothetical protein
MLEVYVQNSHNIIQGVKLAASSMRKISSAKGNVKLSYLVHSESLFGDDFSNKYPGIRYKILLLLLLLLLLITPWSRFLPEKLTDSQLLTQFPAFYRTLRFITAFTRARHNTTTTVAAAATTTTTTNNNNNNNNNLLHIPWHSRV